MELEAEPPWLRRRAQVPKECVGELLLSSAYYLKESKKKLCQMRLVINSCSSYAAPLKCLMESLLKEKFPFEQVVVVIGGCRTDSVELKTLENLCGIGSGDQIVTVIETSLENYDYTAITALYRHRENELIQSDWWMYLLDTVQVTEGFSERFRTIIDEFTPRFQRKDGELVPIIITPPLPNSNICIFNTKLVEKVNETYAFRKMTKKEAMQLECGHTIKDMKPISSFAKQKIILPARKHAGTADVYGTGFEREVYEYDALCLRKFILWGFTGDLTEAALAY